MVQQRSRQESLADEAQREKNKNKNNKDTKSIIDRLEKFFKENPPSKIQRLGPYRPPSWFRGINPKTLPNDLERRYKDLEKRFADKPKEKRGISDKDMEDMSKAKGGTIKVYAKGGGVRKPRNVYE